MALYVIEQLSDDKDDCHASTWHVGGKPLDNTADPDKTIMVQADGHELEAICNQFTGLPKGGVRQRVVKWYGDMAKFIVANLR